MPPLARFVCVLASLLGVSSMSAEPGSNKNLNLATPPSLRPSLSLGTPLLQPTSPAPPAATPPPLPAKGPRPGEMPPKDKPTDSGELSPIDGALLKALPDFKDVEQSPKLIEHQEIRFAETNATAQARRELLTRIRFREMKHIALRDPDLAQLDKQVRSATTDRNLRRALASYNERLYSLIQKLDPSLTPLIEERKAASLKGTGTQGRD